MVGALPLDFRKLTYYEVLRQLREQDAPRPSTRLRTRAGDSATTAQNRGADPPPSPANCAAIWTPSRSRPWRKTARCAMPRHGSLATDIKTASAQ